MIVGAKKAFAEINNASGGIKWLIITLMCIDKKQKGLFTIYLTLNMHQSLVFCSRVLMMVEIKKKKVA